MDEKAIGADNAAQGNPRALPAGAESGLRGCDGFERARGTEAPAALIDVRKRGVPSR
jgi:hypothetical protein